MPNFKKIILANWAILLVLGIFGSMFFASLNHDQLIDWDECIYAQYGKEMRKSGNYLTNSWNGLLGFEKPPLYAWILQVPYTFGVNEITARVFSPVAGILLLLAIYFFTKKYISSRSAIMAVFLTLTSEVVVGHMHRVSTDIGFALFIFFGVVFWITSIKSEKHAFIPGIFFALASLIKGLSVIQFLLPLLICVFINYKREKLIKYFEMLVAFVILIAPWHIIQILIHGQKFIQIYIFENIIKRATNTLEFHFEGRLFYIKLFHRELFPWFYFLFGLPFFYLKNIRKYINSTTLAKEIKNKEIIILIALLVVIPLILLTKAKTRVTWYAMPVFPFIAIFIAYSLDFLLKKLRWEKIFYLLVIFLIFDSFKTVWHETKMGSPREKISTRNEIFMKAGSFPYKDIEYLVWRPERIAEAILPQNMRTSTTFIYGGNPCAVYYSNKKVNYFYSVDKFKDRVGRRSGLYVIENGDLNEIKNLPLAIVYNNGDFTIFKN